VNHTPPPKKKTKSNQPTGLMRIVQAHRSPARGPTGVSGWFELTRHVEPGDRGRNRRFGQWRHQLSQVSSRSVHPAGQPKKLPRAKPD
jgi:hypothetical protein